MIVYIREKRVSTERFFIADIRIFKCAFLKSRSSRLDRSISKHTYGTTYILYAGFYAGK